MLVEETAERLVFRVGGHNVPYFWGVGAGLLLVPLALLSLRGLVGWSGLDATDRALFMLGLMIDAWLVKVVVQTFSIWYPVRLVLDRARGRLVIIETRWLGLAPRRETVMPLSDIVRVEIVDQSDHDSIHFLVDIVLKDARRYAPWESWTDEVPASAHAKVANRASKLRAFLGLPPGV